MIFVSMFPALVSVRFLVVSLPTSENGASFPSRFQLVSCGPRLFPVSCLYAGNGKRRSSFFNGREQTEDGQ
jgi:hypothetical protein